MTTKIDRKQLAADERCDFADFLETLSTEQWSGPTLCADWNVRDVVAHVISYEDAGPLALASAFLRSGFRPARVNERRRNLYADHAPERLIEFLRSHPFPHGLTAGAGGGIGLSDCLIHHQDIRRPLGQPREIPAMRVSEALDVVLKAPVLPARRNAKGLHLQATDLDWSIGTGPTIAGPGEAILLALTGRAVALAELEGNGINTLRQRLAGR